MRRSGCLVLVIVCMLAGLAYDRYTIEQLRRQVERLSHKMQGSGHDQKLGGGKSDLVTVLARTEKHTARAKELLREKRFTEARKELDQALKSLESAKSVSVDIVGDAADFLGKARETTVRAFRKAWEDISKETKPK